MVRFIVIVYNTVLTLNMVCMDHITAYCREWHIANSPAFDALLIEPFIGKANITLTAWNDAIGIDEIQEKTPIIFCQIKPPDSLLANPNAKVVWIPMWDEVQGRSPAWWQQFPKSLRVVAFSDAVACQSEAAGLPTLRIRYFKNPDEFPQTQWNNGRIMFYWNRTSLFQADFIKKLCARLHIDKLLFRNKLDPRKQHSLGYTLPSYIGETHVQQIPNNLTHKEYLQLMAQANIYLAPRVYEGVGMSFLEAMASGCAVFGSGTPTLSEYVVHRKTGYLFDRKPQPYFSNAFVGKVVKRLRAKANLIWHNRWSDYQLICPNEKDLVNLNLEQMGQGSREEHMLGFKRWQLQIGEYEHFVLDW